MTTQEAAGTRSRTRAGATPWPLAADEVLAPGSVQLNDEKTELLWSSFPEVGTSTLERKRAHAPRDLYLQFIDLARLRTTPEQVRDFARRWGILELCEEHGQPGSHLRTIDDPTHGTVWVRCIPPGGWGLKGRERIDGWLEAARRLRALLKVAGSLRQGRCGDDFDWALLVRHPLQLKEGWRGHLDFERKKLAEILDLQAMASSLSISLRWEGQKPDVRIGSASPFGGTTLYGIITAQTMLAVAGHGLLFCAECGSPFFPRRTPPTGERRFCQNCGLRAAWRAASRAYQTSIKEARTMAAKGVPPRVIAERLKRTEKQIVRWLKPDTRPRGETTTKSQRQT